MILLSLLSNLVLQKPCRRALAEGPSLPRALRAALPHLASSNVLVAEKAAVVIGNLCTDATLRKQVHMRDGYPAPVRLPCCCHPPLFFFFLVGGGEGWRGDALWLSLRLDPVEGQLPRSSSKSACDH